MVTPWPPGHSCRHPLTGQRVTTRTQEGQPAVLHSDIAQVSQIRPDPLDPADLLTDLPQPHAAVVHHRSSSPLPFTGCERSPPTKQHGPGPPSANRGNYRDGYLIRTCPRHPL